MARMINVLQKYNTSNKKIKTGGRQKRTTEQYIDELKIKNPNIIPLEEYKGVSIKISHKCLLHDIVWDAIPHNILRGSGCPVCGNEKFQKSKTKDTEKYINEVSTINPYITILGNYVNAKTPILHKCNIHNIEWKAKPDNILHGRGCKICGIEKTIQGETLSNEEYVNRLLNKNPNIKPLEEYINMKTPILHLHKLCGHITKMIPTSALAGHGCNLCVGKTIGLAVMKTHDEFINELSVINPNIEVIGKYHGSHNFIECKCKLCKNIWSPSAGSLLSGFGCPKCRISKGEEKICNYFDLKQIYYEKQYKYSSLLGIGGKLLSYDFYLPQYNTLIEFQGIQHERPVCFGGISKDKALSNFEIQQEHDKRKRNYAKEHNINLLEIWYYDIDNIETILTEYLNNLKLESVETTGVA